MNINEIDRRFNDYLADGSIPNAILLVRKNGELVYKNKWGYADISKEKTVEYDSIFRMMSMTKPVTAVAVMILIDEGKLALDDCLSSYLPEFANMRVVSDRRYPYPLKNPVSSLLGLVTYNPQKTKTVEAERELTVRDLLSHSSGIEQGIGGYSLLFKDKELRTQLTKQVKKYASRPLDFQPGKGTGYSPLANFDILARLTEIVSGMSFEDYCREKIFTPLDMPDSCFFLNNEQNSRLVRVYNKKGKRLIDVTGTKKDKDGTSHIDTEAHYVSGSAGLYGTAQDYEHFAHMLLDGGIYEGNRILSENAVKLMQTEAPKEHLEPQPGCVWGLGMQIRQNPEKGKLPVAAGTFGWSGAFGTHFFVSPADNMEAVLMTNRSNIGGAGSKVSKCAEELVFGIFSDKEYKK